MLKAFVDRLLWSIPRRPANPWPCVPAGDAPLLCRTSHAKPLGMSCWVPIFRAAGLLVLKTMGGGGEMDGEREAEEAEE